MYQQLLGRFNFEDLIIHDSTQRYIPPVELASQIDALWEDAKIKRGESVWNGLNYRLEELPKKERNHMYTLSFGETEFKVNYASRYLVKDILKLPFPLRPNSILISTILHTVDNLFILGQTSADSIHGSSLAPFGGALNKDEMIVASGKDLENFLYKELQEELGIDISDVASCEGIGIYATPTCRIGIYSLTHLAISSQEFIEHVHLSDEHEGYKIFHKEELLREKQNKENNIAGVIFIILENAS